MDELLALRNNAAGAFFMLNAVFVTALFLLQLNKDTIFIDWPLGGTSTFTYDPADNNVCEFLKSYAPLIHSTYVKKSES